MSETFDPARVREVASSSLFLVSSQYRRRANGDLQYDGVRPGPEWQAHGYFPRLLWLLERGGLVRRRLWKRRWLWPEMGETCHSRPPDDAASVWSCTLIIALMLWAWLDGGAGLERRREVHPELEDHVHPRTVQRWLRRALVAGMAVQQSIRRAVLERSEPRPVERLFPRGLSPPPALSRRPWPDPPGIESLWRGLALLFGGATGLGCPAPILLAEARGRSDRMETFPI